MSKITEILMARDGLSQTEADALERDCLDEIDDMISMGGGYDEVENIIMDYLGLEMDYLFDLMEGI